MTEKLFNKMRDIGKWLFSIQEKLYSKAVYGNRNLGVMPDTYWVEIYGIYDFPVGKGSYFIIKGGGKFGKFNHAAKQGVDSPN